MYAVGRDRTDAQRRYQAGFYWRTPRGAIAFAKQTLRMAEESFSVYTTELWVEVYRQVDGVTQEIK